MEVEEPNHLRCQDYEAETLLAFHLNSISSGNILVRSTYKDVLIILVGLLFAMSEVTNIILEYELGSHQGLLVLQNLLQF